MTEFNILVSEEDEFVKEAVIATYYYRSSNPEVMKIAKMMASEQTTGKQINYAKNKGFMEIRINPENLIDPDFSQLEKNRIISKSIEIIKNGFSVVGHTSTGPDDKRNKIFLDKVKQLNSSISLENNNLGDILGEMLLSVIDNSYISRIIVAGGDTGGRAQKKLKIRALQVSREIDIGAPLCFVYSEIPRINGNEFVFKSGQIGSVDFFLKVRDLDSAPFSKAAFGPSSSITWESEN